MKTLLIILLLTFIVLMLVFTPLAIIWALNTLFSLGIAYNFWTWLAVVVLNLTWLHKPELKLSKN